MPVSSPTTSPTVTVDPDRRPPGAVGATGFRDGTMVAKETMPRAEYQAGACNIGPAEIAVRRRAGHVGTGATLGLLALLLSLRAPRATRLLIALPAAGAASGYLQARHRFCAAYGSRGVFNLGALGQVSDVVDQDARSLDRAAARRIGRSSALVGLAAAGLALALPQLQPAAP